MPLKDLFVPPWRHSNPAVRIRSVKILRDPALLAKIVNEDKDKEVREIAAVRLVRVDEP